MTTTSGPRARNPLHRLLGSVIPIVVVALFACGTPGGGPGENIGSASEAITPIYGVDYSWYRPAPSSLVASGYHYAIRYSSYEPGKNLSLGEEQGLIGAGLDVVLVWEDGAENSLSGYNQGASDATTAQAQMTADGAPAGRPIYFCIDFDASAGQAAVINSYFDGVASVLGRNRTGAYGGYYIINELLNAGKITWAFQTYAWSSGAWDSRAQIRQIQNGIASGEMDLDEALATDYGQWGPGTAPPPPACTNQCTDWPRVGMASSPIGDGYWIVDGAGHVYPNGNAGFYGDLSGVTLNKPVVGIAATPSGMGYWMVAADGGVFSFGDAGFHGSAGSITLNKPMVGMAAAPDGAGYWLVASDGGIFNYGSAGFHGSEGGQTLNAPVVGMAATPTGGGYWLVGADGGIFSFGDAMFHGSEGGMTLNKPIVGMAATRTGGGYWLVAADGGIFNFGDAGFHGSAGGMTLSQPVVGMAATPDDSGYWLVAADGGIFSYNAPYEGNGLGQSCSGSTPQQCVLASTGCYVTQAATACAAGSACNHGTCQATCTDACTSGASQCSGTSVELCGHYGNVPCNTWSMAEACPSGQTCMGSACASPTCTDVCEPGATKCEGGQLVACTAKTSGGCNTWGTPTACQSWQTCQASGCVADAVPDGGYPDVVVPPPGFDGGKDGSVTKAPADAGKPLHDAGSPHKDSSVATEGDASSGISPPAPGGAGCGCSVVGAASVAWTPGFLSVAGLALGVRRRRRSAGARAGVRPRESGASSADHPR